MGGKYQYLLFLHWIFTTVEANVTRMEESGKQQSRQGVKLLFGDINWCEMQLFQENIEPF